MSAVATALAPGVVPIPYDALDERWGWIGTSGSGKTYGAGDGVEVLLNDRRRVVIADALGVWWGLRLRSDGTLGGFDVVIFGGKHGDIPITENAGALIGEAVATMAQSAIVDVSELGTRAAERRFMYAFLTAFYRYQKKTGTLVHLVIDEADMWAPQTPRDKDGVSPKLLGVMETIIRRGRVDGFIPWLITQRPAVLHNDVLAMMQGMVAFQLTLPHDRAAFGRWFEGLVEKARGKEIIAENAQLPKGTGIVWHPQSNLFKIAAFPKKVTFDSSAAPRRGEKVKAVALKPLDLGVLRDKLATVETEAKANDPVALKKRVKDLEHALDRMTAKAGQTVDAKIDQAVLDSVHAEGFAAGRTAGRVEGLKMVTLLVQERFGNLRNAIDIEEKRLFEHLAANLPAAPTKPSKTIPHGLVADLSHNKAIVMARAIKDTTIATAPAKTVVDKVVDGAMTSTELTGPQEKVVRALKWWGSVGYDMPGRAQVAAVAGYAAGSGNWNNILGGMKALDLIDYPSPGFVQLIGLGAGLDYPDAGSVRETFRKVVGGPGWKVLEALSHGETQTRDDLAVRVGYSAGSGNWNNILGRLRSIETIDYPAKGAVQISAWAKEIVT